MGALRVMLVYEVLITAVKGVLVHNWRTVLQVSQRGAGHAGEVGSTISKQDVRWLFSLFAYFAFFFAGCGATLLRCIPLATSVVLLHAALRRAPSERQGRNGFMHGVSFR